MSQPPKYAPVYSFAAEMGTTTGVHLDAEFASVASVIGAIEANLALIQRDDGGIANQSVGANAFTSDALALIGSAAKWTPLGFWLTGTNYVVGNVVETGSTSYVCSVAHTAGTFAVDHAAGYWVVISAPRTIQSSDVTGALGYTPVNRAGDTMTGALTVPTGSAVAGTTFTNGLIGTQNLQSINTGLYSLYSSSLSAIVYGFAANVVKKGGSTGAAGVVGGQFSGYGSVADIVFGGNINGIGLSSHTGGIVGLEIDVLSTNPGNTANKLGLNVIFFNRASGTTSPGAYSYSFSNGESYSSPGSGLGSNKYNYNAWALWIQSNQATSVGEYAGWNRGILFDEYSLDSQNDAAYPNSRQYPIGIDFSKIHYYGGSNPVTAFNMEAAIALRDLQPIWWNRDPVNAPTQTAKVRTYFNPFTSRWVIDNGGIERFGIDVTNGTFYSNGSPLGGVSTSAANAWSALQTFNAGIASNSITYTGVSARLQGDMSNATIASRFLVQTTTANQPTFLGVIPNGSSNGTGFDLMTSSAANNCQVGHFGIDNSQFAIQSSIVGSAAFVPLTFFTSNVENMRLTPAGQLLVGTQTSSTVTGAKLRVNGIVQIDNAVAFSVNAGGVAQNVGTSSFTKVQFNAKEFDQNNNFDAATNFRFTPPAGKYVLSACVQYQASTDQKRFATIIYKNGVALKNNNLLASGTEGIGTSVTCIVDANGTDYFEVWTWHDCGVTQVVSGASTDTWFAGYRVG